MGLTPNAAHASLLCCSPSIPLALVLLLQYYLNCCAKDSKWMFSSGHFIERLLISGADAHAARCVWLIGCHRDGTPVRSEMSFWATQALYIIRFLGHCWEVKRSHAHPPPVGMVTAHFDGMSWDDAQEFGGKKGAIDLYNGVFLRWWTLPSCRLVLEPNVF